ncbi:MAG: hypothetical protein KAI24_20330 [Planctomycetes bacterium]|nr:hypothetical protein [Planctomycetota bacterium]
MSEFFGRLFDTTGFPPRWYCGSWTAGHGWLHVISDLGIFGAYVCIPAVLIYFVRRRGDVPFTGVFWLFCAFILSCGIGHLLEAVIFWFPFYRFAGVVKACTAMVSWVTVIALAPTVRKALEFPKLVAVNEQLQGEIHERRLSERALHEQAERLQDEKRDLQFFSQSVVDREMRLIDLKLEVNRLLEEAGRPPRYAVEGAKV